MESIYWLYASFPQTKQFTDESANGKCVDQLPFHCLNSRGVITTQQRYQGDFLVEYRGERITAEEAETREKNYPSVFRYFYSYGNQMMWYVYSLWIIRSIYNARQFCKQ